MDNLVSLEYDENKFEDPKVLLSSIENLKNNL